MATPSVEQLMSLPPEYLAADVSRRLLNTSIAFIVVPTIIFGLFCISRAIHDARDTWDIWVFVPFSYLCVIGLSVIGILMVKIGGAGRHIEYHLLNDPIAIRRYLQLQTATEFLYVLAATSPKLSLLMLYLRIFTNRIVRRITWATLVAAVLLWLAVGVIVWASICQPMRFKWNKSIDGHCANLLAAYRYYSVPNLLLDVVILILPIHTVWHLKVSKFRKFGIAVTFVVGGLGIVAAIIRFRGFFGFPLMTDPTYYGTNTMLLSIAEPGAYFICTSIPYIRPLAVKVYNLSGLATTLSGSKFSTDKHSHDPQATIAVSHGHSKTSSYTNTLVSEYSNLSEERAELFHMTEVADFGKNRI